MRCSTNENTLYKIWYAVYSLKNENNSGKGLDKYSLKLKINYIIQKKSSIIDDFSDFCKS